MPNSKQDEKAISQMDKLLRQAMLAQKQSLQHLEKALAFFQEDMGEMDEEDGIQFFQLVLQYRLDKEDVIKKLLRVNGQHCAALGIHINHSAKKNLDTAAHLLGSDNLHRELALLSNLAHKLNKLLSLSDKAKHAHAEERRQYERLIRLIREKGHLIGDKHEAIKVGNKYRKRACRGIAEIHDAIAFQESFQLNIEQLAESFHAYEGLPKFGLIHDYLAGIKGPISQFHQLELSGITVSEELVISVGNQLKLDRQTLTTQQLVHKLNKVIDDSCRHHIEYNRDVQNQKAYLAKLHHQLSQPPRPKHQAQPENPHRFDDAMRMRRTMKLFK